MSNQKQKLAQMVLQKMKQKKEAQEKSRPHYQVLRLGVQFSLQQNKNLKQQIGQLNGTLKTQQIMLKQLQQRLQELQNTGKKIYPVIIIKPDFIASQNVTSNFKQFYRKAANTFLKADVIKNQKHIIYLQKQKQIAQKITQISQIQNDKKDQMIKNTIKMQQKRTKVLKQDVKRRLLIQEQRKIEQQMEKLKQQNKPLLREYEIKKQNLQNRMQYSEQLMKKIAEQKRIIQQKYNPISYREYLKKVFDVRIKNEHMEKNLLSAISNLNTTKKMSQQYRIDLQKRCKIIFLGKTSDSPSKKKGKIQKNLDKLDEQRASTRPKDIADVINLKGITQSNLSLSRKYKSSYKNEQNEESSVIKKLIKRKGNSRDTNYSSMKTLKSGLKSTIKTDRTLSTTFALSSAKKLAVEFEC